MIIIYVLEYSAAAIIGLLAVCLFAGIVKMILIDEILKPKPRKPGWGDILTPAPSAPAVQQADQAAPDAYDLRQLGDFRER